MFPAQEAAQDAARNLFLEHPSLSISEAARILRNMNHGLDTNVISGIRFDVRERINNAGEQLPPPPRISPEMRERIAPKIIRKNAELRANAPQPYKPPFNPPKLTFSKPTPVPVPVLPANIPAQDVVDSPKVEILPEVKPIAPLRPEPPPTDILASTKEDPQPQTTVEDQQKWVEDWVLEHPFKSVVNATAELKNVFGVCLLNASYIAGCIKMARELANSQKPATIPAPVAQLPTVAAVAIQPPNDIMELVAAMQRLGITRIELLDGHARVEMVNTARAAG